MSGVPSAWLRALVLPLIVLAWLALVVLGLWVLSHLPASALALLEMRRQKQISHKKAQKAQNIFVNFVPLCG